MTSLTPAAPSGAVRSSESAAPKTPREALWRFDIRSGICSEFMPRVLGIVAQHGAIPATIEYALEPDAMRVSLTIVMDDRRIPTLMANAMRRIISVEAVILGDHDGPLADDRPAEPVADPL